MRDIELVEEFYHYTPNEITRTDIYLVETTKDSIFIPLRNEDLVIGAIFLSHEDGIVLKADTVVFTEEGAVGEPTVRKDANLLFISDISVSANPIEDPQPIIGLTREECLQKARNIIDNMAGESWRSQVSKHWGKNHLEPSLVAFCPSFDDKTKFFLIGKEDSMVVIDGKRVVVRKDDKLIIVGSDGVIVVKRSGKVVQVGKHGINIGDFIEIGKRGIRFGGKRRHY